ncbi:retention module-containing protein, partial [Halovibrio variabilis]|uniref:retention module-containing protein n=1 Tax=Halovibrio variabilis TaxID=31910 RepID=UPI0011BD9512
MSIATVVTITGQAWARDPDGSLRELAVGDALQEGETLVTSTNGSVQLDFDDGLPATLIGSNEEVAITNDVDAENAPTEEETVAQDSEIEALLSALEEEDGDLLDLLEATAAGGGAAGGGGGGSDFVQLARIEESVLGLQYEYSVGADEGPETVEFAAFDAEDDSGDTPSVELNDVDLGEVNFETQDGQTINGISVSTGNVAAAFSDAVTAQYGGDGAGSITISEYALTLGDIDHGLESGGEPVVFTEAEGAITGTTNSGEVLRIEIGSDGAITVTQSGAFDHADQGADILTLPAGLVGAQATITVTDGDGDTVTETLSADLSSS